MVRFKSCDNGFTLIELLVVLAIMGLIATVAAPLAARAVEGAEVRADARNLATRLYTLQAQARAQNQTITISADARHAVRPTTFGLLAVSSGASIYFVGSVDALTYFPDGTSSGGTVRIEENGRRTDLAVAWLTGAITLKAVP